MKIKLNGEEKNIEKDTLNISELLIKENVKMPDMVSVEYNGEILDRSKFEATTLSENDEIEFLYFMGGGAS
ncbi:sulfur carrier protein ThiS [bacterium]|nr:sulfur carrier protein ThiS [bacterium]